MTNPIELEMILRKNREEAAAVARDIKQACSRICSAFILGILDIFGQKNSKVTAAFHLYSDGLDGFKSMN